MHRKESKKKSTNNYGVNFHPVPNRYKRGIVHFTSISKVNSWELERKFL